MIKMFLSHITYIFVFNVEKTFFYTLFFNFYNDNIIEEGRLKIICLYFRIEKQDPISVVPFALPPINQARDKISMKCLHEDNHLL